MRDPRLARFRGASLAFAGYLLVQAVSAATLFALKLGGGPAGIRAFYAGSEERFTRAKTLPGLLEVAVPHLVAVPLVLFAAAHVVGFARALPPRLHGSLVALSFGSALAGVLSSFAVRWVDPSLAWLKVVSFAGQEVTLLVWAVLLVSLFAPSRSAAPSPASATAREAMR